MSIARVTEVYLVADLGKRAVCLRREDSNDQRRTPCTPLCLPHPEIRLCCI